MAWNFDNVLTYELSGSPQPNEDFVGMEFDGRDVWVASEGHVVVLGYWDQNSNYEGVHGNEYYPDFYPDAPLLYEYAYIDCSSYLSGSEVLDTIVKVNDHMYVSVVDDIADTVLNETTITTRRELKKLLKFNIASKSYVSTITVTVTNPSHEIVAQHDKIWFTDLAQEDDVSTDRQKLYYYDTVGDSFSSGVAIPTRKQFLPRAMANGRDTYVLLSNNNDNSIMKFNDSTGAWVSEVITNRDPTFIHVSQDRLALVTGADGMVSVVDQVADTSTNLYSTFSIADGLVDDGTYLWSIIPGLARTDKTGSPYFDNFRYMSGGGENYALLEYKFQETTFKQILVTPSFDYQYYQGGSPAFVTRTVRSYIFLRSDNWIHAFRLQALYRENYIQIRATGMVGTGNEAYYGETTE